MSWPKADSLDSLPTGVLGSYSKHHNNIKYENSPSWQKIAQEMRSP